ncbi:hypothetical protein DCC84_01200 [Pseudomonas sp. SXM-1]|nr:hypothetical protein DCC84_01200 [Pseudomonas sp. SXM-1]
MVVWSEGRQTLVQRQTTIVARELAPAGVRSAPIFFGAAAQPSGSKLPRHRFAVHGKSAGIRRLQICTPPSSSPAA